MKPTSIQYAIPDPCEKSWEEMTPETTGRFCGSCQHPVIDFTTMSDFSIVSYLENHKHEKVCGRFTQPQLDRVYRVNQPVFSPAFDLKAVVLGLALTTFSAIPGFSQTEVPNPIDTTMAQPTKVGTVSSIRFDHRNEQKVSGTIVNPFSSYQNVSVHLRNESGKLLQTVHPDEKGNFSIDLDWKKKPAFIEVTTGGFQTELLTFSEMYSLTDLRIELRKEHIMIGKVLPKQTPEPGPKAEDQILEKVMMGNVQIEQQEK